MPLSRLPVADLLVFVLAVGVAVLPFAANIPGEQGLTGWSNYGQWFGSLAGVCAAVAFVVANRTLRLQAEQIREARESAKEAREHMTDQLKLLKAQADAIRDAGEMNGLAAIIDYCARYENQDPGGEGKDAMRATAADAKARLKRKLGLGTAESPPPPA